MNLFEIPGILKSIVMSVPKFWLGIPNIPRLKITQVDSNENTLLINLKCWEEKIREWKDAYIRINQISSKPRIINAGFGKELVEEPQMRSNAISIFILTLPIAPFLLAMDTKFKKEEERRGMSRQSIQTLKQLKGQLHPKTMAVLEQAMKNHYQWKQMIAKANWQREKHEAWL